VLGTVLFKPRPMLGGFAAVVAIALGRALQLLVKTPAIARRIPATATPRT